MSWPRKLSDEQWAQIARDYQTSETCVSIARRFGVSVFTVRWIVQKYGLQTKAHRNKRQKIIRISKAYPGYGPAAVARLVGASVKHTQRVRSECGFLIREKRHTAPVSAATLNQSGLQGLG